MQNKIIIIYNFTLSGWMTPLLQAYLIYKGYPNTYLIKYKNNLSFDEAIEDVDNKLSQVVDKNNENIYVIGIFFGGLIANNLYRIGWNIKKAIYIGCPMRGNTLYHEIIINTFIKFTDLEPYEWLKSREQEEIPPHFYHTISLGLLNSDNDGLLRKIDTLIDNENHSHLYWSSRWTPFLTSSLFTRIIEQIKQIKQDKDIENFEQLENKTLVNVNNDYFDEYGNYKYKDL